MKNLTVNKYKGIRSRDVNHIVWNLYGYKFFENYRCLGVLEEYASTDLSQLVNEFDYIIPIKPRNSGSDIVFRISDYIAKILNCELLDILNYGNGSATKRDLKGMRILIVDDVITTGNTAAKAEKAIRKLGAKNIQFYALAKAAQK